MSPHENARKYSVASFFAGLVCLIFVLFLQPIDPPHFIIAAFVFPRSANPTALNALSIFVFWASVALLMSGSLGLLFSALLKNRSNRTKPSKMPAQYGDKDEGEENWIFI